MTTDEELKNLKSQYDSLKKETDNDDSRLALEMKIIELRLKQKNQKIPDDVGGQIKYMLIKYGVRRSFYLFTIGMTLFYIGVLIDYMLPIPLRIVGFLVVLYGVYEIPFVKDFFKDEIASRSK